MRIKTMPAGVFKASCLAILDKVQAKREAVIITKHGKPVAKLVPVDAEHDEIFGFMEGRITITGDVPRPDIPASDWKHLK